MIKFENAVDAYKISHKDMYIDGIEYIYSNFTPRTSRVEGIDYVISFGLQAAMLKLSDMFQDFLDRDVDEICADYEKNVAEIVGPNDIGSDHFRALHDLGYLPIKIYALPEGTKVPLGVPMFTVENTHPEFFWLTNYLETYLSSEIWLPTTSATTAFRMRQLLNDWALKTTGTIEGVEFQAHDFSMRGMAGAEAAAMSGAGHLLSFIGSDCLPAKDWIKKNYSIPGVLFASEPIMVSVPASEHSVMCSYGSTPKEEFAGFEKLIDKFPNGFLSLVSDGYDFWNVITDYLPRLKDKIMARDGRVVIRPDCYAEGTSIFTNRGWVDFAKLDPSDLVAQVLDDGTYEFVKPQKYIAQDYSGPMYRFSDKKGKVDFLVTPNHRMVMESNGKERIVFAEDMLNEGHHYQKMLRSASAPSTGKSLSALERLKIAFQADGSYQTGTNKIRFSFAKNRKMDRLESILSEAKISYKKYPLSDGRFEYSLDTPATEFSKGFEWVDLSNLDGQWCREFIEELSYWDSSRRSENRFKFDSTNKAVIDAVEIIALSAGYGALVSHAKDDRKEIFSDAFTIHIMKDNRVGGQSWKKTVETYEGKVYCVQVPTGKILVKNNRATLVCGNSGDPADILCGTSGLHGIDSAWDTTEEKGLIQVLWEIFGGTVNDKGFRVLDPHIGAIYGDSITFDRASDICRRLADKGFASTNVVFGLGSFTYTGAIVANGEMTPVTRDTFGFAMKATSVTIDGKQREIFKDPKTGDGSKKSAKGLLTVERINGKLTLRDQLTLEEQQKARDENRDELMFTVDGPNNRVFFSSYDQIRARVAQEAAK